jgi:hypothetical protein
VGAIVVVVGFTTIYAISAYEPAMLRAWGCKFMYDLLQFTSPILLR